MPAMQRKNFYFDAETDDRLSWIAAACADSRAGVLRELVEREYRRLFKDKPLNTPADATTAPYAGERKEALG